ncbi:hypothetical protein [Nonomuraea sp. NPDC049400]|uniref:hypothetical protein n=1 Tax=Nonomuraea sp. NPDC049400 TaxID=3364352 RepID=UPI0037952423
MTVADDDPVYPLGRPVEFTWTPRRGGVRIYQVQAVLETTWATTRQWWREDLPYDAPLDIWHYRLQACSGHGSGVLMLSLDVARRRWSLERFADG